MKTKQIFNLMSVVSWVVFIGYCIKAGAITIVSILSFFVNAGATENLYMGLDLYSLYDYDKVHFISLVLLLIVIISLKAYIFYLLILIFRLIDLNKPFQENVVKIIFRIFKVSLSIGIIGIIANTYHNWIKAKVLFTQIDFETSEYFFLAGVVFVVATLFKRAIDIQTENDLTV
jgi:hypothetical protein